MVLAPSFSAVGMMSGFNAKLPSPLRKKLTELVSHTDIHILVLNPGSCKRDLTLNRHSFSVDGKSVEALDVEDKLPFLEQPILVMPVPPAGQVLPLDVLNTHIAWVKASNKIVGRSGTSSDRERISHVQTRRRIVCKLLRSQNEGLYRQSGTKGLKNQKNKSHKAAKGNQGKRKAKMGYAPVPAPPFAPKPKNPPTPKKDNPANDAICHQYGESLRGSRKLKPGALILYVVDGHHAAVEAIGEFHLCLPSRLVLILHNCHYALSITRGIISVSRLYKDGFVNRFKNDNTILVSRNNLVYFCAIPRVDIFEIDLSSSNTNDSSMYAVSNKRAKLNLDSTLLWHYRLGHINKKHKKKLQYDGLLDSTDIKSFEKCVSCMSKNMERKPYSHQAKRAKDLLGLIHTDVCGPFRTVSRRGASYFVTFTDDFSRYGYVYLLKHKHEVSKTFKVFQKEVENQLEKTIKSLRSNRRDGYMSQEFLDHLKKIPKENKGYSFYYIPENKVFVAQNAEFIENSLITQEASGSLEDLEIIQEEDTHPSIDTSLYHDEDDQEIDEPQSDINPIRKSSRTRRASDRMCLHVGAEEHKLGDLGEPANYKAALLDPKYDKWLNAMNVEMQSMRDNEYWDLVDLPSNGKTVGHKWLFKKKTDMDGAVHTYKACRVTKGFTQILRIAYEENFSPVADIRAIRILIAIAAFYDYEI
uniref:Retrotransposon protein, putative, Ty1-copia subclass n=1 Tax=Tanacetum cinerariifolium TaxID=118510 RepID=A0A6L2L1B9_TANCI|nr:retrotransposon protein, putative, Ty1-copia subclass [Tanacetum cinerariifolium]